ncbi:hypothetical protein [Deinococcus cellulosilyticus]
MLRNFTELGRPLLETEANALEKADIAFLQFPLGLRAWIETEKIIEARRILDAFSR